MPEPPKVEGPAVGLKSIPTEPPFIGESLDDAAGYPLRHPDRAALLNLLRLGRFDLLEKFITYYQDEYEKDFHKELWPMDAAYAFDTADPALGPLLDRWIQHSPSAFSAWLARGRYQIALAWHLRGDRDVRETSVAQLVALNEHLTLARTDLLRALELRPKLIAARQALIGAAMAIGVPVSERRKVLDAGLTECPLCYEIRAVFIRGLQPRWGGSWAAMDRYAAETLPLLQKNPKLELLRGAAAADRCDFLASSKNIKEGHAACAEALRYGDETSVLVDQARLFIAEQRKTDALSSLERALRVDPQDDSALWLRQQLRVDLGDYLGAARDLILVRHLKSTDPGIAERIPWLVKKLAYEGHQRVKVGKNAEAAPYFQLGLELDPNDFDLMQRQGWAAQDAIPTLLAEAASRPDDFELRLRIDHAYATQQRFAEVVTMWDAFISGHPLDPRPYAERGGAQWHLGKRDQAITDMQKACSLGMAKACSDVPRMQGVR